MKKLGFAHKIKKTDPRQVKWRKQRKERGFDDTELWSLDCTICSWLLPRLIAFRDTGAKVGTPSQYKTNKQWIKILDKIILGLQDIADEKCCPIATQNAIVAIELLGDNFFSLWW